MALDARTAGYERLEAAIEQFRPGMLPELGEVIGAVADHLKTLSEDLQSDADRIEKLEKQVKLIRAALGRAQEGLDLGGPETEEPNDPTLPSDPL